MAAFAHSIDAARARWQAAPGAAGDDMGVIHEALQSDVHMNSAVFNALLNCAVHCDQSERAFQVLELMQSHGCRPTL
jgi:pentatricopeptide repeat protein